MIKRRKFILGLTMAISAADGVGVLATRHWAETQKIRLTHPLQEAAVQYLPAAILEKDEEGMFIRREKALQIVTAFMTGEARIENGLVLFWN